MDPNTALERIRALVSEYNGAANTDLLDYVDMLDALTESVEALDSWLSNGGFLPEAWAKVEATK